MKRWTVLVFGEGFVRAEGAGSMELHGVVSASDANAAYLRAVDLASQRWPELTQSNSAENPNAILNVEEINEVAPATGTEVDVVDVFWAEG